MDGALSEMLSNCSWLAPAVNVNISVNGVYVGGKKEKINGSVLAVVNTQHSTFNYFYI